MAGRRASAHGRSAHAPDRSCRGADARERIDPAQAECSSTADVRSCSQFMRGASLCTLLQTVALGEVVGLRERLTGKHRFGVVFQGVDGLLEGGEQILDLGLITLGRAQLSSSSCCAWMLGTTESETNDKASFLLEGSPSFSAAAWSSAEPSAQILLAFVLNSAFVSGSALVSASPRVSSPHPAVIRVRDRSSAGSSAVRVISGPFVERGLCVAWLIAQSAYARPSPAAASSQTPKNCKVSPASATRAAPGGLPGASTVCASARPQPTTNAMATQRMSTLITGARPASMADHTAAANSESPSPPGMARNPRDRHLHATPLTPTRRPLEAPHRWREAQRGGVRSWDQCGPRTTTSP